MENPINLELPWTGERFVPALTGSIYFEHVHRYAMAAELVAGLRCLDIACGEGYGASFLARKASHVIGVDIDEETINHAKRKYGHERLEFKQGSATQIPLEDASVDVVISFETIEHFKEHEEFLKEIKRVLVPGGLVIISSPDKKEFTDRPWIKGPPTFHVRELYHEEFQRLLQRYFAHVVIGRQRLVAGSYIAPDKADGTFDWTCGLFSGNIYGIAYEEGAPDGVFSIAVCSDNALPRIHYGVFEDVRTLSGLESMQLKEKFNELEKSKIDLEKVHERLQYEKHTADLALRQSERELRQSEHAQRQADRALHLLNEEHARIMKENREKNENSIGVFGRRLQEFKDATNAQAAIPIPAASKLEKLLYAICPEGIRKAIKERQEEADIRYLRDCGLFDFNWYLSKNPDVAKSGIDPIEHYVKKGEREGRGPSTLFRVTKEKAQAFQKDCFAGCYYVAYLKRGLVKDLSWQVSGKGVAALKTPASEREKARELTHKDIIERHISTSRGGLEKPIPGKVQVLFVSHEASKTGAPMALKFLAEGLLKNTNIQAWIVCDAGGPLRDDFLRVAPTLVLGELAELSDVREERIASVVEWFSKIEGDKVAICNTAASREYVKKLRDAGVHVISWIHEMPLAINQYLGGVQTMSELASRASRIVYPSEFVRTANSKAFGLDERNAGVIQYGIQVSEKTNPGFRDQLSKDFNVPFNAPIVLGCGTIESRKGTDLFLQTARMILDTFSPQTPEDQLPHFFWLGAGLQSEMAAWCKHDIELLGLAARVHFAGLRDDVHDFYRNAGVFLLTSREDPFPLVCMEAFACELPVVAFDGATGQAKLLENGGVMVPYLNTPAMAKAAFEIITDSQKRVSLGKLGASYVTENFRWDKCAKAFWTEIEGILSIKKPEKTIVIISTGRPPLMGCKTEGGGLRTWGLATGLRKNLADHEIILGYSTRSTDTPIPDGEYEGVKVVRWQDADLRKLVERGSSIIVSYCAGNLSYEISRWVRPDQQLILDCYVPIYVEIPARNSADIENEYNDYLGDIRQWNQSLLRGDVFLCASEAQYKFYHGVLGALGRINPKTYGDSGLRIVPLGMGSHLPAPKSKPFTEMLGEEDTKTWKIMWAGGVYPWFNPRILVEALRKVSRRHPVQMVMLGGKNPMVDNADFNKRYDELVELLKDPELKSLVHMRDWVPYENLADWYLDCDIFIVINQTGFENTISWRTRLVDYVWAGMPVATNGGDPLGEELLDCGAAVRLDISDADKLAENIYNILSDREGLVQMKRKMQTFRPKFQWEKIVEPLGEAIAGGFRPADWQARNKKLQ